MSETKTGLAFTNEYINRIDLKKIDWYHLKPTGLQGIFIDKSFNLTSEGLNKLGIDVTLAVREATGNIRHKPVYIIKADASIPSDFNKEYRAISWASLRKDDLIICLTISPNQSLSEGATHEIIEASLVSERNLRNKKDRTTKEYFEHEGVVNERVEKKMRFPWG